MSEVAQFELVPELFNQEFLPYLQAKQKIQLFTGNRGSGKSVFCAQRAVLFCLSRKYFRLVYCRKIANTIRKSIFQSFKDIIAEWGLGKYFQIKESEMDIICRLNGNMLIAYGCDNPEKLKGIKDPSHIFFDEMTESDFEDYASLMALLRTSKAQTQFWGCFNPEFAFWGREYFFKDHESEIIPEGEVAAKTEDTLILKKTFEKNTFIDPEKYRKTLLELAAGDENYHTVWVEGNWGRTVTGGEFYNAYKKRIHVGKVDYIEGLPVHLTFDFNVLPYMTMLASQVKRFSGFYNTQDQQLVDKLGPGIKPVTVFQVRIFREYCLKDPFNTTEACCMHFIEGYGKYRPDIFFYGDAMGNKRHEGTGNKTEFKKVREILARYIDDQQSDRSWRANPSVLQRRKFMNKILLCWEIVPGVVIQIIIDESCVETQKDLQNVKLGVDGKMKQRYTDPKTKQTYELYGHTSDSLDYLLTKMFDSYFKSMKV